MYQYSARGKPPFGALFTMKKWAVELDFHWEIPYEESHSYMCILIALMFLGKTSQKINTLFLKSNLVCRLTDRKKTQSIRSNMTK